MSDECTEGESTGGQHTTHIHTLSTVDRGEEGVHRDGKGWRWKGWWDLPDVVSLYGPL